MYRIPLTVVFVALLPLIAEGQDSGTASRIAPGDVLRVIVWKNHAMSRPVVVCLDGKISLPLLNDMQAAGLTIADLEDVLTERLEKFMPSSEVQVRFLSLEKRSNILILRPEGPALKRIPFNYNKLAGEQQNSFCPGKGDILIAP